MLDHADTLETVGRDLDEARAKIEATRAAVLAVLGTRESPELHQLAGRLERMAEELGRVEERLAVRIV